MPDWKKEIRARLSGLDLDPGREEAIIEELAQHAADRYEELTQDGIAESDAHQRTLAELADSSLPAAITQVESTPKALFSRRFPFAVRILAKHWKMTVVAVVSLAIAFAASVAGLSLFNALLLRPPAAAAPGELLTVYSSAPSHLADPFSFTEYLYYRDHNHVFTRLAAFNYGINLLSLSYRNTNQQVITATVSDNYFDVLGVHPRMGRSFSGDDSMAKAEVVLSYSRWVRMGADPDIVGKTVKLKGHDVLIAGVAPEEFTGSFAAFSVDVWEPIRLESALTPATPRNLQDRDDRWLTLVGRLKPGFTRRQAEADVSTLALRLAHDNPKTNTDRVARVVPTTMLPPDSLAPARLFSWMVMAIVLLVVVAACANVINLLLALAAARRQELLIRAALGATRGRLARQLLQESTLLLGLSGLLGSFLAILVLERLFAFRPVLANGLPPLLMDFRPDFRVAVFTVALLLVMTVVVGIIPAMYASIPNLAGALNGEIVIGGTRKGRARKVLIIVQTAVCTLVLIGAGLCLRTLEYLKHVPIGFTARNLVSGWVDDSGYTQEQRTALYNNIRQKTETIPGVTSVTFATSLPLGGQGFGSQRVAPEGQGNSKAQWQDVEYSMVEGNYFAMLGMPLLAGRTFDSTDAAGSPDVIVVNRTLAGKFWPGQDPLGQRLRIENGNRVVQVVGLVADSKYTDLDEPQLPFMYFSLNQHWRDAYGMAVIASTSGDPRGWIEPLRAVIREAAPSTFCVIITMDGQINMSLLLPRIIFACVSGFGLLALVLAMAGLYATTSYSVSERKKEIGIRMALGAQPHNVMAVLLRQSALATAIGLGLGLGLGILMSAMLGSLLFGVRPVETGVLLTVLALTSCIALATAYFAARPWIKADPLEAVRHP